MAVRRNKYEKKLVEWLMHHGWESNGEPGILERWRRRTFDRDYTWMTIKDAIERQKKFDKFWSK